MSVEVHCLSRGLDFEMPWQQHGTPVMPAPHLGRRVGS